LSKVFKQPGGKGGNIEPFVLKDIEPGTYEPEAQDGEHNRESELLAIEREAYEKGFSAGEKAGFELGRQKAEKLFQSLQGVLDELTTFKESLYEEVEKEVIELALLIARKIIHHDVESDRESVMRSVRRAMKVAATSGEITIKVNPRDMEVMLRYKDELARFGVGVKGVRIEGDESVGKGGCFIETNYGVVDATVEGLLAEIEEKLKDEL